MNRRGFVKMMGALGAVLVLPVTWVRKRITVHRGGVLVTQADTIQEAFDQLPDVLHEGVVITLAPGNYYTSLLPRLGSGGTLMIQGSPGKEMPTIRPMGKID